MKSATQNRLLAALTEDDLQRFLPKLQKVDLAFGEVLQQSGDVWEFVYFPTNSVISFLHVMENGTVAEIAVVGNEGLAGIAIFLGGESTLDCAVVQCAGQAFRMPAAAVMTEFKRPLVMHLFLHYTQALITQMSQTAVCNRHHSVTQQLCRWLLLSLDRLVGNEITMTQGSIAEMLGVRRESVSNAAGKLQEAGLINYARGRILVLDRSGLEMRSCECYGVVKAEYARLSIMKN